MSRKNCIRGLSGPEEKLTFLILLYLRAFKISCSAAMSMKKSFITRGLVKVSLFVENQLNSGLHCLLFVLHLLDLHPNSSIKGQLQLIFSVSKLFN